jgi:TonB family protein
MKSRRRVNSTVMLLHHRIMTLLILASMLALTFAVCVNAQDQDTHLKCPVTRESLIELGWPTVVKPVVPAYPPLAAARRISGRVRIDVDINSKGVVTAARAITGDKLLADAAQKAALRWTFGQTANGARAIPLTFRFRGVDYIPPAKKPECGGSPYTVEIIRRAIT